MMLLSEEAVKRYQIIYLQKMAVIMISLVLTVKNQFYFTVWKFNKNRTVFMKWVCKYHELIFRVKMTIDKRKTFKVDLKHPEERHKKHGTYRTEILR